MGARHSQSCLTVHPKCYSQSSRAPTLKSYGTLLIYQLTVDRLGVMPDRICFVSSNAWDALSAKVLGFCVVWAAALARCVSKFPPGRGVERYPHCRKLSARNQMRDPTIPNHGVSGNTLHIQT